MHLRLGGSWFVVRNVKIIEEKWFSENLEDTSSRNSNDVLTSLVNADNIDCELRY